MAADAAKVGGHALRDVREMTLLQVFVERGCGVCRRAVALADQVRAQFPAVRVGVVDLAELATEPPDAIVAVPTFLLDGAVLSLGNPYPAEFLDTLAARRAAGMS